MMHTARDERALKLLLATTILTLLWFILDALGSGTLIP